jgi:hypothetical protein
MLFCRLIRGSRLRRALTAACLPWVVTSVLVDFVHVHAPLGGLVATVTAAPLANPPAAGDDYACPACAWLKIGQRAVAPFPVRVAIRATPPEIVPLPVACWTRSPIPRPTAFRGPPHPTFA